MKQAQWETKDRNKEKKAFLAQCTNTNTGGEERSWGRGKYVEVHEGGEESKLASKTGTGGYEDRNTAVENYEEIQSRDDYEEGDAAGEDEEVVRNGEYAEEEVREEEKNKVFLS